MQKCPTSVRLRIANNSLIKHKFIEDMPILIWDKHLNPTEYKRMSRFLNINGFHNMHYKSKRYLTVQFISHCSYLFPPYNCTFIIYLVWTLVSAYIIVPPPTHCVTGPPSCPPPPTPPPSPPPPKSNIYEIYNPQLCGRYICLHSLC